MLTISTKTFRKQIQITFYKQIFCLSREKEKYKKEDRNKFLY